MKKALIVDDDNDLLKLYDQSFKNASFDVDIITNLAEADELIKTKVYDIIVLDLVFPNSDALPTIRLIRSQNSQNANTPIIILTNLDFGEKTKEALKLGANECMFKVKQTPKDVLEVAKKLTQE
ncbi:MAG: response regulator [Candidatus Woesebacteria bacterium]|jgi:DNA-binding response OmpR family regulator